MLIFLFFRNQSSEWQNQSIELLLF